MVIGIDARFWGVGHSGLGVYTQNLVENLAAIDTKNQYYLLLRREMMGVNFPENFHKICAEANAYSLKEQILIPWLLYKIKADLVHFTSINFPVLYFGKSVVTIHDLIKHHSRGPQTSTHLPIFYWFKYLLYLFVFGQVVKRAIKIITPTNTVKDELGAIYKTTKVVVTYEAGALGKDNKEKKIDLPDEFAIYVGNAYPHKNLGRLIDIWPKVYEKTGTELVFSSGRSVFTQKFQQLSKYPYIKFMGYLSNEELVYAFKKATVYVFPTLIEGFGIPGLDAMKFGLPVVCSNISVLKEIYGDGANYFDPLNVKDMEEKIVETIENMALRKNLIAYGKKQVAKYSWQKLAKNTLDVYEKVARP